MQHSQPRNVPDAAAPVAVLSPVHLVANLLSGALAQQAGIDLRGYGTSLPQLLSVYTGAPETILVYDGVTSEQLRMLERLKKEIGPCRVVVFGVNDAPDDLHRCAVQGVHGLVSRDAPLAELVCAIKAVARGAHYTAPALADALMRALASRAVAAFASLTAREQKVMGLIARGLSNEMICSELQLRTGTLESHLQAIYRKLDVHSRADVARIAVSLIPSTAGPPGSDPQSPALSSRLKQFMRAAATQSAIQTRSGVDWQTSRGD